MNETAPSNIGETTALQRPEKTLLESGTSQVFDMQGRYLGTVELKPGVPLHEIVSAKFKQSGKFMLKQGGSAKMVTVKNNLK